MDLIKEIHQYLHDDIKDMNELIVASLNVEEELVTVISNYLAESGGKRIRPMLTLLTSKMFDYNGSNHFHLAAAVEFIHMATLLHDDVVDGSKMRRFVPTANVIWGSKASILVGDFMFSQSFKLIVSTKSISALEVLSSASAIIAEGEVSQLAKLEEHRMISEHEYLKIINAKTAELFAAACEVGAIIVDQDKQTCEILRKFGRQLGIIFQIVDDVLDYYGSVNEAGKNSGDDFLEGKVTLPLIFLHDKLEESEQKLLIKLIKKKSRNDDDFELVKTMLDKYDVKSDIANYLQELKKIALYEINQITVSNQYKDYLCNLVDFAISRSY